MPSAWSLIDTNFPTFSGDERVRDQVDVILNYMFMLAEGLKYQLSNLGAQNFNTTALKDIQIETTADVEKTLEEMVKEIGTIQNSVSSLRSGFSSLDSWQKTAAQQLQNLENGQVDLNKSLKALSEGLEEILRKDEAGNLTIGKEGLSLNLIGSIYINGQLVE